MAYYRERYMRDTYLTYTYYSKRYVSLASPGSGTIVFMFSRHWEMIPILGDYPNAMCPKLLFSSQSSPYKDSAVDIITIPTLGHFPPGFIFPPANKNVLAITKLANKFRSNRFG